MITGFNTDVDHDGRVYHVQTEDRGTVNPVLESLVYIGGTIIAKKATPYGDQLHDGATEQTIATLLKRQHQVIIAAIKAGRIEDLKRMSTKETRDKKSGVLPPAPVVAAPSAPRRVTDLLGSGLGRPSTPLVADKRAAKGKSGALPPVSALRPAVDIRPTSTRTVGEKAPVPSRPSDSSAALNLDEVISDYLKKNSEQGKLDLQVLVPAVFMAGKTVNLRVQVSQGPRVEPEAIVTIKIIGTAFKPQVYIGRPARDGVATFGLTLPAFTAGTAAIVIEAQSRNARGELKQLIRRA